MTSSAPAVDFRSYRPAAVVVIDLVKHSTRERTAAAQARSVLEHVLASSVQALGVAAEDAVFNFTGDGYICAFLGDASSRVVDFLNCTIPRLRDELRLLDQPFRCGIDFGFVHLASNALTRGAEHFDVPGVIATRLEHAAGPNEILGSELLKQLFAPLYPHVFSDDVRSVQVKDHTISCYALTPLDFDAIRTLIHETLFSPARNVRPLDPATSLLILEDDRVTSTLLEAALSKAFPEASVVVATDGADALRVFNERVFALAVLDINVPVMDGLRVAEIILAKRPETIVIMESGMGGSDIEFRSYEVGAALFLRKPVRSAELRLAVERCLAGLSPARLRSSLVLLSSDVGHVLRSMWRITAEYSRVVTRVEADPAISLLRHKAKAVANDLIAAIRPGAELRGLLEACEVQLSSLNRLSDLVARAHVDDVVAYLRSVVRDYGTMHPKIDFRVHGPDEARIAIPNTTLFTLSVCELIDNAIAAVMPSGQIDIALAPLPAVGVLHTRVRDSGPGVPDFVRERMFESGRTTKGQGRGLGLSLVHDAVQRLGGSVRYEYDAGATFTIDVPLG